MMTRNRPPAPARTAALLAAIAAIIAVTLLFVVGGCGGRHRHDHQSVAMVFDWGEDVLDEPLADDGWEWGDKVCYAAGRWKNKAALWENGVLQVLGDSLSWATSVHVSGGDVYVVGNKIIGKYTKSFRDTAKAVLWKNGVEQVLSGERSSSNTVYVSDGNVYVAGIVSVNDERRAALWENGTLHILSDSVSAASSVYVSGGDVYVAGEMGCKAALWKNGVPRILSDNESSASSVHSSNGDVYVVGHVSNVDDNTKRISILWKNGVPQNLVTASIVNSVYVSNGVAYAAGWVDSTRYYDPHPTPQYFICLPDFYSYVGGNRTIGRYYFPLLWKDGILQPFIHDKRSIRSGILTSVHVSGNDVYVAGVAGFRTRNTAGVVVVAGWSPPTVESRPAIWKNGVLKTFGDKHSSINSIFIKE